MNLHGIAAASSRFTRGQSLYVPPTLSMLGTLAASMSPGSWLQVTGLSSNMSATFHRSTDVVSGSMLNDCSYFPWNPVLKRIEYVGMDHYNVPDANATQSHCWFDDASGLFVVGTHDDLVNVAPNDTPNHGFQHTQVDPVNGDTYHYQGYNHSNSVMPVWKCAAGGSTFTHVGDCVAPGAFAETTIGSLWWTGAFTARSLGSHGAFMIFNCGGSQGDGTGEIGVYDPINGVLTTLTGVTTSAYVTDYGGVASYSAIHNCGLIGGGRPGTGNAPISFRLNSDGTTTRMPDCPNSHGGFGSHLGTLACDPVTGNFIVFSDTDVYELNPTGSGTWTAQTGGRAMPSGMQGNYSVPPAAQSGGAPCSIPDYGVIAHTIQQNASVNAFWLYKHA